MESCSQEYQTHQALSLASTAHLARPANQKCQDIAEALSHGDVHRAPAEVVPTVR